MLLSVVEMLFKLESRVAFVGGPRVKVELGDLPNTEVNVHHIFGVH